MREIVDVSITSYRFAMGGEHYYGKLHVRSKATRITRADGSAGLVTRSGYGAVVHPNDGHELTRRIGAKEAAYLNRKDDGGFLTSSMGLRSGDMVKRFPDPESVVKAAIAAFPALFDETDVLQYAKDQYDGLPEILIAPADVRAAIEPIADRYRREDWLMANGYLIHEAPPEAPPAGDSA